MDRRATIAQKQRMRGHGFHYMISAEKDDRDAIDAFCKLHGLTRSSVLVRGALALCGIPLKGCGGDAAATACNARVEQAHEPTLADECGGAGS